ncbi:hypothetical protein ES703_116561 [subsurface metagenome]
MKVKLVVSVGLVICVAISFLLAAPVHAATPKLAASITAFGGFWLSGDRWRGGQIY